jgi:multidrug efflux pump
MIPRFFIDRPIFAAVLSILITLAGALALPQLGLAQYPLIAPPTVQVDCNYPGASAQVVAESIAAPIEQQVNGVEEMLYMASQCTNDGSYTLTVTFKLGVDLDIAQVLVQNRVNLALPQLPDVVKATGVITKKRSPDILLVVSINSPTRQFDQLYLSNYAALRVREELVRLPGISEVIIFGQRDYSLRVWLDPEKMATRSIAASDVVAALREQNLSVAMGQVGQAPNNSEQATQLVVSTQGRLQTPEEFAEVIVKRDQEGRLVQIRDIAEVQLGPLRQDINNRFNTKPTIGLAVFQQPNANALQTADLVKAKMAELSQDFPEGIIHEVSYDTTPFIRESINEVFKALRDSVILVAIVVLVFLQSWRSALIPLIAVPVAIVGTFAVMYLANFSLNNLTLFGLVLAIGIVVDDAIVVVEAVEHHIEKGLSPREATIRAMDEVTGPVIAIGLVLAAVFVPCAFITGIVGQFFRQFALTIAIATLISTFNSLTLSPALAAILLKPKTAKPDWLQWLINLCLGWFFALFNFSFRTGTTLYTRTVAGLLRVSVLVLIVYAGLIGLTWFGFQRLPSGFIPAQDKGFLLASIQLPDATAASQTRETIEQIEKVVLSTPGVRYCTSIAGNSFLLSAYGSNFGSMFIILDEFHHRTTSDRSSEEILKVLRQRLTKEVPQATVGIFGPPPVSGLGRGGGFRVMIEDRGEVGLATLQRETEAMVDRMTKHKGISSAFTAFRANAPQLEVKVDRAACLQHGVELTEVFATLQIFLGSRYVNDFNLFGRTYQVVAQADAKYRDNVEDVAKLKVRNKQGDMVPLGAVCSVKLTNGPLVLTRYNMYPAASINGSGAVGFSSGRTIRAVDRMAEEELPPGMALEFTELYYLEQISRNTGMMVFVFSVVFVFLVLAALYESWTLPMAVILVVPMCVLGSIAGVTYADHDINIFTQVGFIVLIGLACKNAILIVEFAKLRREEGVSAKEAALEACQLRLRPILMTSLAFILGVLPLVIAEGAGSEMRRVLGTAVFSGMLGVTLFGIFLTPVFFVVIDTLTNGRGTQKGAAEVQR